MCIKKDKMVKKIFRYLLFKQKQSADLKNFDISYIKLTFVKTEFYFLCGRLYKEF